MGKNTKRLLEVSALCTLSEAEAALAGEEVKLFCLTMPE